MTVAATETTTTHVEVLGRDADQVHVRQDGDQISVVGPKAAAGSSAATPASRSPSPCPTRSTVVVRTGSANIVVTGTVGTAQLRSGSGDVEVDVVDGALAIETGSGDIRVEDAARRRQGQERLRRRPGRRVDRRRCRSRPAPATSSSGRPTARPSSRPAPATSRSATPAPTSRLTTGSGDLAVTTARRGRMTAKCASGDVRIGVPAGVPVWTDISTVSGEIRSNLTGAGEPAAGADHVEVRAKTVSGDIVLTEV